MNQLSNGARWMHARRHEALSSSVLYTRASGNQKVIRATIGRTGADQLAESELITSGGIRDYLFRTCDFFINGVFVPPAPRDVIKECDLQIWDVAEIGGEPCWRYSDEYRNAIRVHAVKA